MKVIDLINMINNKEDLPEKMIINKIEFHSNVFKTMIYEEDCNTDIWMAIQLNHIDLDDYVKIMQVELIEDEVDIDSIKEAVDLFEKHNADIDDKLCIQQNRRLINKLIRCIKQLNKEIKELKEK